jgi:DNA-binding NarL/FixJ family response regulator
VKVLIVDDSNVVRDRIVEMISSIAGVEIVGEAANSIEAIHMVNKLKPDVVTLDIRIPGESGIEVLKKIKRTQPSTTVLVLTNFPQEQYKNKCYQLGGDYFFSKSEEFEKVEEVINNLACEQVKFN